MARIIAIANQKGGVGKTTTAVNLAASLADLKERALLIDLDPQGNATTGVGVDKNALEFTTCDLLLGEQPSFMCIQRIDAGSSGFDLLPANGELTAAEVGLMTNGRRERVLTELLAPLAADYDSILIDCPPSLNMLTLNALVAAQGVLIPIQCEYYALEGLSALLDTIEQVRSRANPGLEIEGILRTMHDARNGLSNQVSTQLITHFTSKVYRTVIPRNVRLAEAPSHGLPVSLYDASSRGAIAYQALASELLRRRTQNAQLTSTAA